MRLAITLVLLGACFDPEPPPEGPYVESHVATTWLLEHAPPTYDVLLVVDNTSAMSPYASRLPELARAAATMLETVGDGFADVRVAVTTNGGALSPILDGHVDWSGVHITSFNGSLGDVLAPLVEVGASNAGPAQPLDAMHTALASSAFARENAPLVVVTMSATDDASPPLDYVSFLKGSKSDPSRVVVSGIYTRPSPNLDAFHQSFPNRSSVISIDAPDYADAFTLLAQLQRSTLEQPCFEDVPLDLDPDAPGLQADCNASASDQGIELARVPMCDGSADPATGSCLELSPSFNCPAPSLDIHLRGLWRVYHPEIHLECVTK